MRYRAVNSIGPGPWSAINFIAAATVPKAPPQPSVSSVDNTEIILSLGETTDDGGSAIIQYYLYVNEGSDGSAYHEVDTYDGSSLTHTVNVGDVFSGNTISVGNIYTFKFVAENNVGLSLDSNLLQIAIARPPLKPS